MSPQISKIDLEHLELMQKRVEFLVGAKICDRKKILKTSSDIDQLRRKTKGLKGVDEVRRWRGEI